MVAVLAVAPTHVFAANEGPLRVIGSDTDDFPEVALRVKVTGTAALDDLGPSSFEVSEDGDERPVRRVETAATGDLEVIVVFDRSGSMAGTPVAAAKLAVANFVDRLPDEVSVGLVSFGSQAGVDVAPTLDRAAVIAGIDALRANGRTALYDAVFVAADAFSGTKARRLMVVLSDGGDNASLVSLADAETQAADSVVEVIELATPESNREALDRLVQPGPVRSVESPDDLESVYGAVIDQLLSEVIVTYDSALELGAIATDVTVDVRLAGSPATESASATFATPVDGGSAPPQNEGTVLPDRVADSTATVPIGAFLVVVGLGSLLVGLLSRRRRLANRLPQRVAVSWTTSAPQRKPWLRWVDGPRGEQLTTALRNAGVRMTPQRYVVMVAAATVGASAVFGLIAGPLAVAGLATPWAARSLLRSRTKARREKFLEQLPDTLQVLSSMLRSGYGLVQAIDAVARESDDPTNVWFDRVLLEVRTGRDLGQALKSLAEEIQSVDFDWVVVAVEINREVGGEMARTLESVAETVRERDKLRGQVRALTAEGRMSAYLMLALPPITALATIVLNPEFGRILFEPVGFLLIGMAATLMFIGWAWITRIVDKVAR